MSSRGTRRRRKIAKRKLQGELERIPTVSEKMEYLMDILLREDPPEEKKAQK